jgi:glycosyltransferase involved in cell wall biosynthesis
MVEPVLHRPGPTSGAPIPVSILVCAFNEEENLPALLSAVLSADGPSIRVAEVVSVASGCTDRTVAILHEAAQADPRVRCLVQERRGGKASAMACGLAEVRSEVLIILNADTVPEVGALAALIVPFRDPGVSLVCARPLPANLDRGLVTQIGKLLWEVHDRVSQRSPKAGEAFALRRSDVQVPADIEDDDTFLGAFAIQSGGRSVYVRSAVIRNRVPSNLPELISQRYRINRQVLGLRRRTGIVSRTWDPNVFALAIVDQARSRPGSIPLIAALAGVEALARAAAVLSSLGGAGRPTRTWAPLTTTKARIDLNRLSRSPPDDPRPLQGPQPLIGRGEGPAS